MISRFATVAALAVALASAPAVAQELTSTSGSGAEANSGSISGAQSDQGQAQTQNANIGVSRNENTSASQSGAISGSASDSVSGSFSDQGQAQSLDNRNANENTNQSSNDANNSSSNSASNTVGTSVGQQASNQQGVSIVTNNQQRRKTEQEFRTNTAVPLAASSSFSSDYCGGTASGGASAAPLGISIGGAGPVFDKSCQSLRRAEKFGMIAANFHNMQQPEMALKAMAMMIWSVCTADSQGPKGDASTAEACSKAHLLGESAASAPSIPSPGPAPEAKVIAKNGQPTSEAVAKAAQDQRSQKLSMIQQGH